MLERWNEFPQRLKLNLKEEQLTALPVLRQLSKEKSGFKKRSDLFDYFVISVLKLRILRVYFKIRKPWDYIRGYPSTALRNLCLLGERLKPEFTVYSKGVLRPL